MRALKVQTAIQTLFPPNCLTCRDLVTTDYGLCARCWKDLPLIAGPACDLCGTPVLAEEGGADLLCESCAGTPRPWHAGRAAMRYSGLARKFVSGLKHHDRYDYAPAAAQWMAGPAAALLAPETVIAPVPLHWTRLVKRRYNQAAMLAFALGQRVLRPAILDLLIRVERGDPGEHATEEDRRAHMRRAFAANPKRLARIAGAKVLLVDDVMFSGATLTACAEVCLAAGAMQVDVVTLARAAKEP